MVLKSRVLVEGSAVYFDVVEWIVDEEVADLVPNARFESNGAVQTFGAVVVASFRRQNEKS